MSKYTSIPEVPEGNYSYAMNLWLTSVSENMELLIGQRGFGRALSNDEFDSMPPLNDTATNEEIITQVNRILLKLKGR